MDFLNLKATIESFLGVEENMGILENKIEELSCPETDVQAELHTAPDLFCLGTDLTLATYNTQTSGGAYNPQIQAVDTITTGGDFTMGPKIIGDNVTYIQGGTGKKQILVESIQSIKENLGILENKIELLSGRKKDVQAELHTAQVLYGQKPKSEIDLRLRKVQRIKDEVPDIRQKLGELRWFHFLEQMNLAKHVEEKINEVVELRENEPILSGLFVSSLSSTSKKFPLVKVVGEETALKNMKEIEKCLMDDKVGKIGVFGMAGVGKTTLMTQIYNKIKNANTFERVIWVTVSRDSCLKKLQDDVSKELKLDLSNDHAIDRSAELFGVFNRMGRFLLILDDMWDVFPLGKIGILEPNEENKCKIVWTTRSKRVCRGMGSHKYIEVEGLKNDESWTLFQGKLGANDMSPELESIAKEVVKECDGLPLAIITVGAAMRDVDNIRIWRNVREELRNSRSEMIEEMEDDVFACLNFSFDKLKTQRLQDCFLYCALYPEDAEIHCRQLIDCWMADGLLYENEDCNKGFDEGYTIIDYLKDACMLESCKLDDCVKMHDLLRDLAINITKKSRTFVVKTGIREKQISWDENLMTGEVRVSLMSSNITEIMLSFQPKSCTELSTMLLSRCHKLEDIHHSFFEHMNNLRVLDLSYTGIVCLPKSISNLKKLRVLSLNSCGSLKEVPSLAKLKELRVLDLHCTSIKRLPEGLECLTNLRRLRLDGTSLETFPAGVISNLSYLEEIATDSNWKWSSNDDGRGACVEEMLRLKHLRRLYTGFYSNAFNCYVRSGNMRDLDDFHLYIGDEIICLQSYKPTDVEGGLYAKKSSRRVEIIKTNKCLSSLLAFPENTLELYIGTLSGGMTPLSEIPSMWSLKQLTKCSLYHCAEMEYILAKDKKNAFLPALNVLNVHSLRNLRSICKDLTPTESGSLASLKTIHIKCCANLKFLFSVGWLQALQNLEEILVNFSFGEMEELVVETEEDMGESSNDNDNAITLPRLRILELFYLPKLKSISKRIFICNSLEEIIVRSCPNLKKLPLSINSIPSSLKRIQGSNKWWDSLEWDNPDTQSHLQPFFEDSVLIVHTNGEEEFEKKTDGQGEDDYDDDEEEDDENTDTEGEDDDDDDEEEDENTNAEGEDDDDDDVVAVGEEDKHGTKRKADTLM